MALDHKILLDTPAEETLALGFDQLADAFAQIIRTSEPRFAIGLFGSWGSGKTTLMRRIETRLDGRTDAVVWFAAWRYEKEEHLIVPLLDAIREAVLDWGAQRPAGAEEARTLARTIGAVTASLVAGFSMKVGIPGVADLSFKANDALKAAGDHDALEAEARTPRSSYHASFTALKRAFAEFQEGEARRIVVFIDDLDRCLPDGALEVLESMKLFFDLQGFVFVVGLDATVVERFVEHRYRELLADGEDRPVLSGEAYLRKIFQVPFGLRPVTGTQIVDFLEATIASAKPPPDQVQELRTVVLPYLTELVTEDGFNPRDLKRFINAYTIQRQIRAARGEAQPGDERVILALQVVAERTDWTSVQAGLLALRGAMLDAVREYADGDDGLFTAYLGVSPAPSFGAFLRNPGTGAALVDFARTGREIDGFLFDGTSLNAEKGTSHIDGFQALGRTILAMDRLPDLAAEEDPEPLFGQVSQSIEALLQDWRSYGLTVGLAAIEDLEKEASELAATEMLGFAGQGTIEEHRVRQRALLEERREAWRAVLQGVMLELQRDFRART